VHGPPKDSGKAIFYETIPSLKKDQQKNSKGENASNRKRGIQLANDAR